MDHQLQRWEWRRRSAKKVGFCSVFTRIQGGRASARAAEGGMHVGPTSPVRVCVSLISFKSALRAFSPAAQLVNVHCSQQSVLAQRESRLGDN